MLHVKTYLDKSPVHGIGLFAGERIPKGTIIWTFDPNVDSLTTEEKIQHLTLPCQEQIRKYSYFDTSFNAYVMCGDDARFMNHSSTPACSDSVVEGCTTTVRDIEVGEELTCDYSSFTSTEGFDYV